MDDSSKVNILLSLGKEFRYANTDTSLYYVNNALELSTRLNYEMAIAESKKGISAIFASQGKFMEGIQYGVEALALYINLYFGASTTGKRKILDQIGRTCLILGHNRISQGNYPEGLKNTLLALKIREALGDKPGIADARYNMGNIYSLQLNYAEALKYYHGSLELSRQLGDKSDIASVYNTIGWVHVKQGKYLEALKYCTIALRLANEIKDNFTLAEVYNNLAMISDNQGNYNEALSHNSTAVQLYLETGMFEQLPLVYNNIAGVYIKMKQFVSATGYLDKALYYAGQTGSWEYIKLSHENWALLETRRGNYKNALEHYKLFIVYRDSLFNQENTKKMVQQQMQFDFDKREDSIKRAQDQKDLLTADLIKNQRAVRNFSFAGAVAVLVFSGYGFKRYRRKKMLQGQETLMNERLRISRELHDEVGATLSGIAMYSHLTKEQVRRANTSDAERSLDIMQQSAGDMVNKLNDIVWLVNPGQDSMEKLVQRLEEYASDMAMLKEMTVHVNVPDKIPDITLPVESRRNIYLLSKEAINNAVKYSGGSLLELSINYSNNHLEISVSDNGKGFDPETVRRGNGLENMRKRAEQIDAELSMSSKPGKGCYVSLKIKIAWRKATD